MGTGSQIALEAYFDEGDVRFLAEVLRSTHAKGLGALAGRWFTDRRPELRRMLLEYVDDGCERPHHQPLIKRLYKLAEENADHELLAHFLVTFDRLARRRLESKTRWDWQLRQPITTERIVRDRSMPKGHAPTAKQVGQRGRAPEPPTRYGRDPRTGRQQATRGEFPPTFTFYTRRYLQRRVWRYFRVLGKRDPEAYLGAIVVALQLYRDEHLQSTVNLLDAWSLLHVLYHHSPLLVQEGTGWILAEDADLSALRPAPAFPEAWKKSPRPLFELVVRARARTVRLFAIAQLREHHKAALTGLDFAEVRRLLSCPDEEVQLFVAELLRGARGLEKVPVAEWLKLVRIPNPVALPVICELFERNVLPERVSTEDCLALAQASAGPVATLGFNWLRTRPVASGADLDRLIPLGNAEAQHVRREAVDWLIGQLRTSAFTRKEHARELVDARFADVRARGLAWIFSDERFAHETALWAAMAETPYDDVREALAGHLEKVGGELEPGALRSVWASVLLAIHRGSRAKLVAARQIAERVIARPAEAESLLPLLSIALRSLRPPEQRSALAALAKAAYFAREVRGAVAKYLPSLVLFPEQLTVSAASLVAPKGKKTALVGGDR